MAIRLRKVRGHIVALCAAKTKARKGDVYLDDNIHHALSIKFWDDFQQENIGQRAKVKASFGLLMVMLFIKPWGFYWWLKEKINRVA